MSETTVAIVFHSGRGHTERQARAVERGVVRVIGASAIVLSAAEGISRLSELAEVDAVVFGAPTYMGSASGEFKMFMDATSSFFMARTWQDKIAAGFTNSSSRSGDKLGTLIQFSILAAQHGMHWVSLGLPPGNNSSTASEQDLNRLGFALGAAAQSNFDQGPEIAPPDADLRTAEKLGERVALITAQFVRGRLVS